MSSDRSAEDERIALASQGFQSSLRVFVDIIRDLQEDNDALAVKVASLESALATARTERDDAVATRNWEGGRR